jgi:hypothetical protein
MTRSATDVMHDVIVAAVTDAIGALKTGAGGLPNTLLRDIGAIHSNTAFADLPPALREAIHASVRTAFIRLMKEGYAVAPRQLVAAQSGAPRAERPPRPGGFGKPAGPRPNRGAPRRPPGVGKPRQPGGPGKGRKG